MSPELYCAVTLPLDDEVVLPGRVDALLLRLDAGTGAAKGPLLRLQSRRSPPPPKVNQMEASDIVAFVASRNMLKRWSTYEIVGSSIIEFHVWAECTVGEKGRLRLVDCAGTELDLVSCTISIRSCAEPSGSLRARWSLADGLGGGRRQLDCLALRR